MKTGLQEKKEGLAKKMAGGMKAKMSVKEGFPKGGMKPKMTVKSSFPQNGQKAVMNIK